MTHRRSLLRVGTLATAAIALGWAARRGDSEAFAGTPVDPRPAPPLVLPDDRGRTFDLARHRGSVVLVYFGYTHCPDVCPATLAELTTDIKALGADAARMRYVFVTLDPARDTPGVLKDYVGSFDSHIIALTGTSSQVAKVAKEWSVFYRIVPGGGKDYTLEHSASSYLMDKNGRFAGFFTFNDSPATQLAKIRDVINGKSAL